MYRSQEPRKVSLLLRLSTTLGRSLPPSALGINTSDGALVAGGIEDTLTLVLAVLLLHCLFDLVALLGQRHRPLPA